MNYSNLDISKFKYTKLLEKTIKAEKYKGAKEKASDRASGAEKLIKIKAHSSIDQFFRILASGGKRDLLQLKELKLEKEYIIAKEKEDLKFAIELKTKRPVGGSYTLAEIGDILNLTRERVRQIEFAAGKVLKHPLTARKLKQYREE